MGLRRKLKSLGATVRRREDGERERQRERRREAERRRRMEQERRMARQQSARRPVREPAEDSAEAVARRAEDAAHSGPIVDATLDPLTAPEEMGRFASGGGDGSMEAFVQDTDVGEGRGDYVSGVGNDDEDGLFPVLFGGED
jgi:hypothetical protein